jgi:nitrous oxidase accessory protein
VSTSSGSAVNTQNIQSTKNVFFVDSTNSEGSYSSIQTAIDSAPIGSTISIQAGTYNEIIKINKQINLIGEDKTSTIISTKSTHNGCAIEIRAEGVTISGFQISNTGSGLYATGIKINAPQTKITDCIFIDTPIGIAVWSSENTIQNCQFSRCTDEGIVLLGSFDVPCIKNVITSCEFSQNCDGIELQYASENSIINCKFFDNTHSGIDAIFSNNANTIDNCEIKNNAVHGIYLSRSNTNTIKECSISNNKNGDVIIAAGSLNNQILNSKDQESSETIHVLNIRGYLRLISSYLQATRLHFLN